MIKKNQTTWNIFFQKTFLDNFSINEEIKAKIKPIIIQEQKDHGMWKFPNCHQISILINIHMKISLLY